MASMIRSPSQQSSLLFSPPLSSIEVAGEEDAGLMCVHPLDEEVEKWAGRMENGGERPGRAPNAKKYKATIKTIRHN